MRLHQRAGIWLLWWPCAWSLAMHGAWLTPLRLAELLAMFAAGAVAMRGAGCIVNDIADRKFDAQVARTRTRPLASGELNVPQALLLLAVLLTIAAFLALELGFAAMAWAAGALPLVVLYPLAKRVTHWPQLVLGMTFNWGVLVASVAATGGVTAQAWWLYAGCVMWTLGYDTLYALQDKEDDARAGVRSTALRFGDDTPSFVMGCYGVAFMLWLVSSWQHAWMAKLACFIMLLGLLRQVARVEIHSPLSCQQAFRNNVALGWIIFLGFLSELF